MKEELNKKNDIAGKLVFYFFISLLIFALIISAAFTGLFRKEIMEKSRADLEKKATGISQSISEYVSDSKSIVNFSTYISVLNDLNTDDIWIIDDSLRIYTTGSNTIKYKDLPASANQIVLQALKGQTVTSEDFGDVLKSPSVTVATPIYSGSYITGVMLMHSPISGMQQVAKMGFDIIVMCIVGALLISLVPAVWLSKSFTDPIVVKEAQEAIKLEKMRRDYVANVSHELKTPVTVLRGSLEALVDGVVTDKEEVDEYHREMLKETVYLQRMVIDLLELSRLQNSGFEITKSEVSLKDILNDTVKSAEKLASAKNITIDLTFSGEEKTLMGDYGRLKQMFLVILDNAVKFSPENERISVMCSGKTVAIKDHGCGIESDRLPHIFDRFHRSGGEINKTGSGLGLAIAKEIAARHGVKISVKSEIGVGTEFIFEF